MMFKGKLRQKKIWSEVLFTLNDFGTVNCKRGGGGRGLLDYILFKKLFYF